MIEGQRMAKIQGSSARLRRLVGVLIVALWVLLVLERFGWAAPALIKGGSGLPPELPRRVWFELIASSPEVLFILSLTGIRQALGTFVGGDLYSLAVSRMLRRVGTMLAAGAFLKVFVVPALDRAIGLSPGYWIAFDVTGLVLGAIGLSLAIFARVLERAGELKAELDEIF
jgi:hypothetical protein